MISIQRGARDPSQLCGARLTTALHLLDCNVTSMNLLGWGCGRLLRLCWCFAAICDVWMSIVCCLDYRRCLVGRRCWCCLLFVIGLGGDSLWHDDIAVQLG